jgi:hypothetical protein
VLIAWTNNAIAISLNLLVAIIIALRCNMDKNSKAYKRLVNNLMKTDDGSKFIIEVTGWLCLENNMDEVSEYIEKNNIKDMKSVFRKVAQY